MYLFRFSPGTFDERGGLELECFTAQSVLVIDHSFQNKPEMESPKGDLPSYNPIKLYCHCTRSLQQHTHIYTHMHNTRTPNTQLTTAKKKKKRTQFASKLGTGEGEQNKNPLRIHDQYSSLTWLCNPFHIIKVVQTSKNSLQCWVMP